MCNELRTIKFTYSTLINTCASVQCVHNVNESELRAYRTGALTIRWEHLIAGADVIGGTGSESSQLPAVDSVKFAMCGSSSRKSSTFVPMLVPPGTFLRSFLFL